MKDIKEFRQFHARLDDTLIGYTGITRDGYYVEARRAIVVCHSHDELREWLIRNGRGKACNGLTFDTCEYGAMFRYSHEEPIPYLLDALSLERFQACRKQDERFLHAIRQSHNHQGTSLAPAFDFYEDSIQAFQKQLQGFLVGYGLLNADNQLIQNADGCELLMGRIQDAEARAQEVNASLLPFTAEQLSRHEDEGYLFQGDVVTEARWRELAGYQDYCDYMASYENGE